MTNGNATQRLSSTDLGLVIYLQWKGATLAAPEPWTKTVDAKGNPVMQFNLDRVNPEDVGRYQQDAEGIQRYNAIRRHMLRIIHTEMKNRNGDSADDK